MNCYRKKIFFSISLLCVLQWVGCTPKNAADFMKGFSRGYSRATYQHRGLKTKHMLFGGANNSVFLGRLNCPEYENDSIYNKYGSYGSNYGPFSIWNANGIYGSKYSQYSPWNLYAPNPPIIVDQNGNFYGYFTVNKFQPNRTRITAYVNFLEEVQRIMH